MSQETLKTHKILQKVFCGLKIIGHILKPVCMADVEWESAPPTFTRLCINFCSGSLSVGSEIMWRGYSWPSAKTFFRSQMWYNFCLKLKDSYWCWVTILQLISLLFSHLQQSCGLPISNLIFKLLIKAQNMLLIKGCSW